MQHYNWEMYVHVPNKISMGSPTIYLLWLFLSYKKTAKYYLPLWSSLALETNFSLSKMADDCQQLCINNNKCSFSAFSTISCGFSTHFTSEKDYVQVSKCQKDIGGHLRSLKLNCARQHPIWVPFAPLQNRFFCKHHKQFPCMSKSSCKTGHKMEETVCKMFLPRPYWSGQIRTVHNTTDVQLHSFPQRSFTTGWFR